MATHGANQVAMFADWKRTGNVSYTVSCSCVYVCAHARARVCTYACVCTWICVMCVCMSGGWVCLTIPVTPVSAPINTHRKNYIAPLYIEWRISCHTPPPIPTAGTQLTHRTSSCACHPTLSPRAFHLAKRSMLEQALRELRVRATQGGGGSETMDTHTAKKMRCTNLRVSGQSFPSQYQTCARSHQFHPLQSDGHLDSEYAKEAG